MGQSNSKYNQENLEAKKVDNIRTFLNNDQADILESLNLGEFNATNEKMPLPLIGGNTIPVQNGGAVERYSKHDIFALISSIEDSHNNQTGGNLDDDKKQETTESEDMLHVKQAVLKELNSRGGCGCESNKCSEGGCGGEKCDD